MTTTSRDGEAPDARTPDGRLRSLDVLRGGAITGMIVVNNQGDPAAPFPGTAHAAWHGFTAADLVFPLFLFAVGASLALSLGRRRRPPWGRVVRRASVLFLLGVLLNALAGSGLQDVRIMGVLQRIALCYLLAALVVVHLPARAQWLLGASLLLGHWALLTLVPVPGHGAGSLSPAGNVAGYVDRLVLGAEHMYHGGPYDPEGLLGTLPAVVTVLAGYRAASYVRRHGRVRTVSLALAGAGGAATVAALLWSLLLPLNKRLWTGSFTLLTAGLALVLFAFVHEAVDVRGHRAAGAFLAVFGTNAILAYVGSEALGRWLRVTGRQAWLHGEVFAPWAGSELGSLGYGLGVAAVCWVPLVALHRRRWFVRV